MAELIISQSLFLTLILDLAEKLGRKIRLSPILFKKSAKKPKFVPKS